VGDIFDLSAKSLGVVDALYDRAALVALPEKMRSKYITHLIKIADKAPQLLICYEYDLSQLDGPPFSIGVAEVMTHYQDSYEIKLLESVEVAGGFKGKCPATEHVWYLS